MNNRVDEWLLMEGFPFRLPEDFEARINSEGRLLAIWSPSKQKYSVCVFNKKDLKDYNRVVGPMVSNMCEGNVPLHIRLQGMKS